MKFIFASIISFLSVAALGSPFQEYYGKYSVTSCEQSAEYSLANFCGNSKSAELSAIQGSTSFTVSQQDSAGQIGSVGILFNDSTSNPKATYISTTGRATLIDPTVFSDSSLTKIVNISKISDDSISIEFSMISVGWPDVRQNMPLTVKMVLKK